MLREKDNLRPFVVTEEHQNRYDAVFAMAQLFDLSHMAYVIAVQRFDICEKDAERQMERFKSQDNITRLMMLSHIETVMGMDPDFALEVGPQVDRIKEVLGIK